MKRAFLYSTLFIVLNLPVAVAAESSSSTSSAKPKYNFEIRTAPIAFLAQWLTIDLTYMINKKWAVGPSYVGYENKSEHGGMLTPTYLGKAIGLHFIFAESYTQDSYYIGGHYYSEDYRSRPHAYPGYYDNKGTRGNIVAGHRWVSGKYSSMLGFGFENKITQSDLVPRTGPVTREDNNFTLLHIEFKLGMLF